MDKTDSTIGKPILDALLNASESLATTPNAPAEKSARIEMPSFETYGEYSSDNYGAHTLKFHFGNAVVYFSYQTPIAFRVFGKTELVVRENDWKTTTGKHLNWIDGGSKEAKKARVSGSEFERQFAEAMNGGVA